MEYLLPMGMLRMSGGSPVTDPVLAIRFDGTNYLRKAINDYRIADSSGSITAWFKTSVVTGIQTIFYSGDEGTVNDFVWLFVGVGSIGLFTNDNGVDNAVVTNTATFDDGQWHFVEARSSGTAWTIRVDGVNEALSTDSGANNGDWFADIANRKNVVIGAAVFGTSIPADTSSWFIGDIDNVIVFSTPLTDAQADWMYANVASYLLLGSSGDADNPGVSNVGSSWSFNELTGTITDDTAIAGLSRVGFPKGATFAVATFEWAVSTTTPITVPGCSICASFKTTSLNPGVSMGIGVIGSAIDNRTGLAIHSSNKLIGFAESSVIYEQATSVATCTDQAWHFGALSNTNSGADVSSLRVVYLDGVAESNAVSVTPDAVYDKIAIASFRTDAIQLGFKGTLDNVSFWNIAITAAQEAWLRTAGAGGGPVNHDDVQRISHADNPGFANIGAWFTLNEKTGTTFVNVHNPGTHDLTMQNTPTLDVTGHVIDLPVTVARV